MLVLSTISKDDTIIRYQHRTGAWSQGPACQRHGGQSKHSFRHFFFQIRMNILTYTPTSRTASCALPVKHQRHFLFPQSVASIIRTTLGPRSMLKMILDPMGGIVMVSSPQILEPRLDYFRLSKTWCHFSV